MALYHIMKSLPYYTHLESVNIIISHTILNAHISSKQKINLDQIKEQLKYYLSYQAQKVYLNAQFKSS